LADSYAETDDENIRTAREKYRAYVNSFNEEIKVEREKVRAAGGLFIIGTERHESRRIDNQLRGRAGRQGDPGCSRFYISMEDDLMRLFGSERMEAIVETLGLEEDQVIEHKILSGAIESAQKRIEGKNFDIRKNVLQYDDVMNQQREIIYAERKKVLNGENLASNFSNMLKSVISESVQLHCHKDAEKEAWDVKGICEDLVGIVTPDDVSEIQADIEKYSTKDIEEKLFEKASNRYNDKEEDLGSELMREVERVMLLRAVDENWMTHIDAIDQLKHEVGLQAYGQRNPLVEYKFQSFDMFEEMNKTIQRQALRLIFTVRIQKGQTVERKKVSEEGEAKLQGEDQADNRGNVSIKKNAKVGRNDPCPCGSGKKYKNCCGKNE